MWNFLLKLWVLRRRSRGTSLSPFTWNLMLKIWLNLYTSSGPTPRAAASIEPSGLTSEQQPQAQAQQPQAPLGAAAAQIQVGEVFCLRSQFIFRSSAVLLGVFFPCPGLSFCYFCCVFPSHGRVRSLHVCGVLCQVLPFTVCVTLCCRPARIFCYRVSYLRKGLILCSTLEIVWSCIRPEK